MCNDPKIAQQLLQRQMDMFRLAERDHDLTVARIAALTGFHRNTVSGWKNGTNLMELPSFVEVCKHMPDELSTLIIESSGKAVVTPDPDAACFDELAETAAEYLQSHVRARSPASPAQTAIAPCEKANLIDIRRKLGAKARAGQ